MLKRGLTKLTHTRPPTRWRAEIAYVLIPAARLRARVKQLARQIERDYAGRELVIIPLLTGTVMFLADLIRFINLPLRLDFMGVSSYREGTVSREVVFTKELRLDVKGRDVLIIDDILDTGRTIATIIDALQQRGPASLALCALLRKPGAIALDLPVAYIGFDIPDEFVVGCGMDYAERHRNLRGIHRLVFDESCES